MDINIYCPLRAGTVEWVFEERVGAESPYLRVFYLELSGCCPLNRLGSARIVRRLNYPSERLGWVLGLLRVSLDEKQHRKPNSALEGGIKSGRG